MSENWPPANTYLCSFHGGMFEAPAGSVDRTKEVRCPDCAANTLIRDGDEELRDEELQWLRLRWARWAMT